MADAVARIDITSSYNGRGVRAAERDMTRLQARAAATGKSTDNLDNRMKRLDDRSGKLATRTNRLSDSFQRFGTILARITKFGMKLFLLQSAALVATLASVNAAFALGNVTLKLFRESMAAAAYGAATLTSALALVAAAQREYTAAMYAFRARGTNFLGDGTAQNMAALRTLTRDTELAVFGFTALNAAFSAYSANAQMTARSVASLRAMGDFAAAGGDMAKNIEAAASFLGLLEKEGKITADVLASAGKVSEEFKKAVEDAKKRGITTAEQFNKELLAGGITPDFLEGQLDAVSNTLFGRAKAFATEIISIFGDMGQQFLPEATKAFDDIAVIVRRTTMRIGSDLGGFASERLLGNIVSMTEKIADFSVKLFEEYLPKSEGLWTRIMNVFSAIGNGLRNIRDFFEPLREGSKVLIDGLTPFFKSIVGGFGNSLYEMNDLLVENKDEFMDFGNALASVADEIGRAFDIMRKSFVNALPVITSALGFISNILSNINSFLNVLAGSSMSGLAGIPMALGAYGAVRGRRWRRDRRNGVNRRNPEEQSGGGAGNFLFGGSPLIPIGYQGDRPFPVSMRRDPESRTWSVGFGRDRPPVIPRLDVPPPSLPVGPSMPLPAPPPRTGFRGGMDDLRARFAGRTPGSVAFGAANAAALPLTLGLGMFGGEEARAAAGVGSLAAMVNPMLGLGVTGAMMTVNSRTAGGSMLGGAMTGAAAGSFLPGVGTIAGAAIGLVVGGIVHSFMQPGRDAKRAEEAATTWTNQVMTSTLDGGMSPSELRQRAQGAIRRAEEIRKINDEQFQGRRTITDENGQTRTINQHRRSNRRSTAERLLAAGVITEAEAEGLIAAPGSYAESLEEQADNLSSAYTFMANVFEDKVDKLSRATGMTNDEIEALAEEMGVNLYDNTLRLADAMDQLGVQMPKTVDEVMGAIKDAHFAFFDIFAERREGRAIVEAVDQSQSAFLADPTVENTENMLEASIAFLERQFPNDPFKVVEELIDNFIVGGEFGTGGALEGMGGAFAATGGTDIVNQYIDSITEATRSQVTGLIQSQLAEGGYGFDIGQIEGSLAGKSLEELSKILNILASPTAITGLSETPRGDLAFQSTSAGLSYLLGEEIALTAETAIESAMTDGAMEIATAMTAAVTSFQTTQPDWWNSAPGWWANGLVGTLSGGTVNGQIDLNPGDTANPKAEGDTTTSRLGRTMARHRWIDGGLSGKRSVSSAWRNWNLGSMNSDHVTGNAYDLVGQNLGQYASVVNGMGGFAEFHGRGGSRHLHVVPPATPMGDTSVPSLAMAASSAGSVSNATYNFTIVAGANASADDIARQVMARIEAKQRDSRERS